MWLDVICKYVRLKKDKFEIDNLNIQENRLDLMQENVGGGKSTLIRVMAWYHHATSDYLNQRCPRSMWPYMYGVTKLQ